MKTPDHTHPALEEFAKLATSFCGAIANADLRPAGERLRSVHSLLSRLYAAVLDLPPTSTIFDEECVGSGESPTQPSSQPNANPPAGLYELAEYLGPRRFYREIFGPYSEPGEEEVGGDLIVDLGELHDDIAGGLAEWTAGRRGEALWEWRFNFKIHWGKHATSAIRALHALSAWYDQEWPTGE